MDVLVRFSASDVSKVCNIFEIDREGIAKNVEVLKNWLQQQKHLPQNQSDDFFERFLLKNKFRIEQAKQKIDAYYTLRGIYREFYQERNEIFIPSKEVAILLPLPRLTPKFERIYCLRVENSDPALYDFRRIMKYYVLICELMLRHDYSIGERIILDGRGVTLEHLKKLDAASVAKMATLHQKAYSGRPVSIEVLNAPAILQILLKLLKFALPSKIFSRIKVHDNLASLHESCPKNCLPKDYGGDLAPVAVLNEKWDRVFDSNRNFFDDNYWNVSDEKLRVGEVTRNHLFGVDGTFKTLNLD